MKIKIYLLTILLCSSLSASAQISHWAWAKSAFGSAEGSDLAADNFGNVYVAGNVIGTTITFGAYTLTNVADYYSACVAKYDASGDVLWARIVPGSSWVYDLATDNEGNVYMSGQFDTSSLTFGSDTLNKIGTVDAFLVKYDSSGNLLWARSTGLSGAYSSGLSVATDIFDNVYLAGDGGFSLSKYDVSGNLIWSNPFFGVIGKHIATDPPGNIYMTGYFSTSPLHFGSSTLISAGGNDAFLFKFDSSGNALWAKSAGGVGDWDLGWDVGTDHYGHVYISGIFDSPILYTDSNSLVNAGCNDIFLSKYDSSGNEMWATSAGGTGDDQTGSGGLSIDEGGNIFLSGSFGDIWCGWDSIVFGQFTLTESSWDPMFVVKYDQAGNVLCATSLTSGGNDVEFPNAITADPFGNAYTGADFGSTMVVGSTALYCVGENLFVAKYSCDKETAINELSNNASLIVSPNLSNGIFQLAINKLNESISEIEVYNLFGEKVFSFTPHTKSYILDLRNKPNGIYLLTVNISEQQIITKIVKE